MDKDYIGIEDLKEILVGKTVRKIHLDSDQLAFKTDENDYVFSVEGDCCSHSYFQDFYGVKNLIDSKIKNIETIELVPGDSLVADDYEDIKVYGYRIITEGNYGEQSSVFSFRNRSNGYYGGWMNLVNSEITAPEITKDTVLD